MSAGTNYHIRSQFLPARNTQYSRHLLLKNQREQILKLRQINLVAHNVSLKNYTTNPFYCPKKNCQCQKASPFNESDQPRITLLKTYKSPYEDSRTGLYAYDPNHRKVKSTTSVSSGRRNKPSHATVKTAPHTKRNQDVHELRDCYRRIFNDDVESFKLLLKNQEQFGRAKIPLVINCQSHQNQPIPIPSLQTHKCQNINNGFPKKKAPYVPQTFLRRTKKKTVSPSHMDQLVSNNTKPTVHQNHVAVSPDQKPKTNKEPAIVINLPEDQTKNNNKTSLNSPSFEPPESAESSSMSREEFISINEELLDDDLMRVPNSDGLIMSRSSSSVSNIIEEMIKDKKIQVADELKSAVVDSHPPDVITDTDIVLNGVFPTPPVGLGVLDENGQKGSIIWHDPEPDMEQHQISEALLDSSKSLAARRKSEIKQLLEEYSSIAQELDKMEVK